ncbi:protein kinase [Acidobacteriota bacterium]
MIECPKCSSDNSDTQSFCGNCRTQLLPHKDHPDVTKTLHSPTVSPDKTFAGKYKIIEEIGRGGMGIVYKAEDTKLKRKVALKFLPAELMQDKHAKARFLQEAQAAAALNHPNICTVYEVDVADDQTFIAMEFIEGQTLKDKIDSGPLDIDDAVKITTQVAEGLAEAHAKGIVHRDIKPANIILTDKGTAKIMDFGIAKLATGVDLTQPSTLIGTVAYMSPEQARGDEVDLRTDIWSLGAIFYEMLTGERPFQKSQEQALIYAILHDSPTPVSLLRSDIPTHVEKVIEKALAKKTKERYQNIEELIQDLSRSVVTSQDRLEKSIVVLPFDDLSPERNQEYFSDGLTEEISADLSRIHSLRVISRTSAMMFKGTKKSMKTISKELGVRFALEGSVRKAGNNLRITVQLIDGENDVHLWANKYSGTLEDIFEIQESVAKSVVDALSLVLTENAALPGQKIQDLRAFECLLRARTEIWKGTESSVKQAMDYLNESRRIEGDRIEILSALAESHLMLPLITGTGITEAISEMENLANRILSIDNASSHGYLYLALAKGRKPWGFRTAGKLLKRACELDPTNVTAQLLRATFAIEGGYPETALACSDVVVKLDPLSPVGWMNRAFISMFQGDFEEASDNWKKVLSFDPHNNYYRGFAINFYANASNRQAVEEIVKDMRTTSPDNFVRIGLLYDSALRQREDEFKDIVSPEFIAAAEWDETLSWVLAQCYACVGNVEESIYWLKKAMERCFINYPFLSEIDPFIGKIKDDKRVRELLLEIKREWENFEI